MTTPRRFTEVEVRADDKPSTWQSMETAPTDGTEFQWLCGRPIRAKFEGQEIVQLATVGVDAIDDPRRSYGRGSRSSGSGTGVMDKSPKGDTP